MEFLSEVDRILVMEGGRVTQSGGYEELLTSGTAFEQLVNAHKNAVTVLHPQASEFVNKDIILHFPQIQIFSGKFWPTIFVFTIF